MNSTAIKIKEIIKSSTNIYCHHISISDTNILINCGLPEDLNLEIYGSSLNYETIDFILFTHFDINYIGALPYIYKNGFRGKIYSTVPVKNFGKLKMLKTFCEKTSLKEKVYFSINDLENSFNEIQTVKYLQPIELGQNIKISAYNCGFGIGGSIWKIWKGEENLIFGINFDHKKTNHLNGIDLSLPKNAICVFDSNYVAQKPVLRKERNLELTKLLTTAIKNNKKVLIITDFTQFIEISLVLDELLIRINNTFRVIRAGVLNFVAKDFAATLKGMVEWSGDVLMKEFADLKENPYSFKFIDFFDKFNEMGECDVYVCFEESIFSKKIADLLKEDSNNLIINFLGKNITKTAKITSIPIFLYREIQVNDQKQSISESLETENLPENEISEEKEDNFYFPTVKRIKTSDEYNKPVPAEWFKNETQKVVLDESFEETKEYIEEISFDSKIFVINNEVFHLNWHSFSDFTSSKNVIESLLPSKLILLNTQDNLSQFYFYKLKLNKAIKDIQLLDQEIELFSLKGHMTVKLSSIFHDKSYKIVNDISYLAFEGLVLNNELHFIKEVDESYLVGEMNLKLLKKCLLSKGLFVESISDTRLVVSNELSVELVGSDVVIEGTYTPLYYFVLDVLKEQVFYV